MLMSKMTEATRAGAVWPVWRWSIRVY